LKDIDNPAHLTELMETLNRGFQKFDVDFVIIGASVRGFWIKYIHQIGESKRATKDIDFAIEVKKISQVEHLIDYLVENEKFKKTGNKFRLIFIDKVEIDLSPFGAIELEDGYENWVTNGLKDKKPSTVGLKEAFDFKSEINVDNEKIDFKIITLESLAMLKIIAWNDRPEIRQKDAQDLAYILDNYYEIQIENIFEYHWDLLDEENTDDIPWRCGARVLGRNMRPLLNQNGDLKKHFLQILEAQIQEPVSKLANAMANDKGVFSRRLEILKLFLEGLRDEN
jgi:predicted nucleotidyltransferase